MSQEPGPSTHDPASASADPRPEDDGDDAAALLQDLDAVEAAAAAAAPAPKSSGATPPPVPGRAAAPPPVPGAAAPVPEIDGEPSRSRPSSTTAREILAALTDSDPADLAASAESDEEIPIEPPDEPPPAASAGSPTLAFAGDGARALGLGDGVPVAVTELEGSLDGAFVDIEPDADDDAAGPVEGPAPEPAPEPQSTHPIDIEVARAQREDAAERIEMYERELGIETSRARAALLEHEIGDQLERMIKDEPGAVKAYARSLSSDPMLRPNLWAVRRIFYRRRLWPSLLKLLDAETRYASTDIERAELWTERGHVLEDCVQDLEEAVKSYQAAHRLDPSALDPLAALEKVFARQHDEVSLIEVYRALAAATQEPGRRVALLFDLARIEEAQATALGVADSETAADEGGTPLDRSLSYLHAAYEVGVDQLRVVDEIIRIAAAHERVTDCLAALDVKAELLELGAEQASPARRRSLGDEVVAVRRWQAALAKEKLRDPQLVWQYLQLGNSHSPGDPLILHDMIEVAESTGRWTDLEALLGLLAERRQQARPERPPLGLLMWRAQAMRLSGRDGEAEELEHKVRVGAPVHLPFLVSRERRALRREELTALGSLYREEAEIARRGLVLRHGEPPKPDPLWATGALLRAGTCYLRAGEYGAAKEILEEAQGLGRAAAAEGGPGALQAGALVRLCSDALEAVYERTERWADLVALYEKELGASAEGARGERLHEALCELYAERLADPQRALAHNTALLRLHGEDLRLRLRGVELLRRAGDGRGEAEALRELDQIEARLGPGERRIDGMLRRAELLAGLGDDAGATALYEEVLRYRPGETQALGPLELLLRRAGRFDHLQRLLRSQADACASAGGDGGRLLGLQVKLAELYERELEQPAQAAAIFRDVLIQRPGYVPALGALARLYRRLGDWTRLGGALELLAEALPAGQARADVLVGLGEVYEDHLGRPREAEDAYGRAVAAAGASLTPAAAAVARNQASDERNLAPDERNLAPDERNLAPDERNLAPDERNLAPDERNLAPDERNLAPDERNRGSATSTESGSPTAQPGSVSAQDEAAATRAVLSEPGHLLEPNRGRQPAGSDAAARGLPAAVRSDSGHREPAGDRAGAAAAQGAGTAAETAAHAALGRLRALGQQKDARGLPEATAALGAGLSDAERARLDEERGALLGAAGEEMLTAARDTIRAQHAQPGDRYVPLPELGLWQRAAARGDGKRAGVALDDLVTRLDVPGTADDGALGGLWLRAGILGALHHDEEGERAETWRRLLRAYHLTPASPAVLAAVGDTLLGTSPAEQPIETAEVLRALRRLGEPGGAEAGADAAPAPRADGRSDDRGDRSDDRGDRGDDRDDDRDDDQIVLALAEGEALLSAAARGKVRDPAAARSAAAEAALAALQLDPRSLPALWLLRRATAPALGAPPEAVRAYALYTLRMGTAVSDPATRATLFHEAAELLRAAGDLDGAAATLREVLDIRPEDPQAFGQAYELLMARAQPESGGGVGDAGPLLELLDFRLAWQPDDELVLAAETPLRVALYLQRAALRQAAGQSGPSMEDLRALLALDPGHLVAQRRLADLLAAAGQLEESLGQYERFLQLEAEPGERRTVHVQLATLLSEVDPARASAHLGHALALGPRQLTTAEWAEGGEAALYRWQVRLLLQIGDYAEAVAVLRRLADLIPPGPEHGIQLARVELEVADVLQTQAQDPTGALIAVERALMADPLSLEALDRMVQLCGELGEGDRQAKLLSRAMHEARTQVSAQTPPTLSGEPYHALAQIYSWQRRFDANQLAVQAECAVNGTPPRGERPHREPQRPIGSPLATRAFGEEARGVPLDLWREIWESASRLVAPEVGALGANPKERLNAKGAPPAWADLDRLAAQFGLNDKTPYALFVSREREQCQLSGMSLVCGGAFAVPPAQLPPRLYARLLLRLALLPDRLGAVVAATGDELLLVIAAACRLGELRGPDLGPALSARLDEQVRALGRLISRKEKKALSALGPRLDALAGSAGRARILEWQQAVRMGAARLGLALSGSVAATLDAAGVSPRDSDPQAARAAQALLRFAVSAEIQDLRRELGVDGEEGQRAAV